MKLTRMSHCFLFDSSYGMLIILLPKIMTVTHTGEVNTREMDSKIKLHQVKPKISTVESSVLIT